MTGYMQSDKWGHDVGMQEMMPGVQGMKEPPPAYQSDRKTLMDLRKAQLWMTSEAIRRGVERDELKTMLAMITPEVGIAGPVAVGVDSTPKLTKPEEPMLEVYSAAITEWQDTLPPKVQDGGRRTRDRDKFYDALAQELQEHSGQWGKMDIEIAHKSAATNVKNALTRRLDQHGEIEVKQRGIEIWCRFNAYS